MLDKHIILLESENNVWVAYSISNTVAERMSKANLTQLTYYIFKCPLPQQYPYCMKLKYPLNQYYRVGITCSYREEAFTNKEEYLLVHFDALDDILSVEIFNHEFNDVVVS